MNMATSLAAPGSPEAALTPTRLRRRSRGLRRALVVTLLVVVAIAGLGWLLSSALAGLGPVHLVVDGAEMGSGWDPGQMPPAHRVVLAGLMISGLLIALTIVPFVLLALAALLLVLLFTVVGLPLALVLAGVALILSPLWLLAWLVWKIVF